MSLPPLPPQPDDNHSLGPLTRKGQLENTSSGHGSVEMDYKQSKSRKNSRRLNIVLTTLLVLTLVLTGYLVYLARSWSDQSQQLDSVSKDLGQQVAELQTELNSTQDNLGVAEEQLTKAQHRITELASEKALVGDDRESQRIIAQDTAQVANEALAVSGQLGTCISDQTSLSNLISEAQEAQNGIIRELAKEEPDMSVIDDLNSKVATINSKVSTQRSQTNETCAAATDRYNSLLSDLNEE